MGNSQSIGAVVEEGIKVYKSVKEQQEQQEHQQAGSYSHAQHQEHHENYGQTYHQIQQEHDDPEYSQLRALAHEEAEKRNACYQRSQEAYRDGDGALGKSNHPRARGGREIKKRWMALTHLVFLDW